MPKISIIVPCYNQAEYLEECLESVLSQSHPDWECIIVDDGSTDNSAEIARKWVCRDRRFYYYYKQNSGVCIARNFGVSRSSGEWILPLDGDDKITSDYLLNVQPYLTEENKIVYGNVEFFGRLSGMWNLGNYSLENLAKFNMIHVSAFYKKSDFIAIGGYDLEMKYGLEDWEFYVNLLKDGGSVVRIEKVGLLYRIQETSRTSEMKNERKKMMQRYLEKKHFDFFYDKLGSKIDLSNENDQLREKYEGRLYKTYNLIMDALLKIKSK